MPTPPPPDDAPPALPEVEPTRPDVSAFDRVQTRSDGRLARIPLTPAASRGAFWRVVAVVALVSVLSSAAVWWFSREPRANSDLLGRLADVGEVYQPALLTTDAEQAERYVEDASGWRIDVPELPGLQLIGVGFADLSPQASVPAFRYDGAGGEAVVVYAYDYVFLDSIRGTFTLSEPVYAGLAAEPALDTRRSGGAFFVSWRRRAVIYTAVTASEAAFERIGVAVAE